MIVPRLEGGLGNQMFQIAAACGTVNRFNSATGVFEHRGSPKGIEVRQFGVNFNLPHTHIQGFKPTKYRDTFYKNIPITDFVPETYHKEPFFHYQTVPDADDILLWGYFQSDKYFEGFHDEVRNLFTFSPNIKNKIDDRMSGIDKHTVSVHVRRGDYLRFPNIHPTCSVEYYTQAFSRFPDSYFIVASDDIPWCEQNISGERVIFSNCTSELEDLYLLSQCDSSILSNSSFAWWGSYLGKEKDKVIAPKTWFGPGGPQDFYDIYRAGWETL